MRGDFGLVILLIFLTGASLIQCSHLAKLWESLGKELVRQIPVDPAMEQFSLAPWGISLDFTEGNDGMFNYQLWNLADAIPTESPMYSSDGRLSEAYAAFLESVQHQTPDDELLESASNAYLAASEAHMQWRSWAVGNYSEYKKEQKELEENCLPFTQWADTQFPLYTTSYRNSIIRKQEYDSLFGMPVHLSIELENAKSRVAQARDVSELTQFNCRIGFTETGKQYAPKYSMLGFKERYREWVRKSVELATKPELVVQVTASLKDLDWIRGTTDNTDFVSSLTITYAGFGLFEIPEPLWFNHLLVELYHDSSRRSGEKPVFGPSGLYNLRTTKLVIGFDPTMYLNSNDTIEGHGDRGKQLQSDITRSRLVFKPRSKQPFLLGVISTRLVGRAKVDPPTTLIPKGKDSVAHTDRDLDADTIERLKRLAKAKQALKDDEMMTDLKGFLQWQRQLDEG